MPCSANDLVNWAKSQIGVTEDPKGSNNVVYNTHYYNRVINNPNYAWCAVFIWDGLRQCGASELYYDGGRTAYVPALVDWARKNKLVVSNPQPGDIVVFDWDTPKGGGDHVAICIDSTDYTVTTIDGNVDDAVKQCIRNRSEVLMFIRPKYTAASTSPKCNAETCPIVAYLKSLIKEV